jgi:hypothetical protein
VLELAQKIPRGHVGKVQITVKSGHPVVHAFLPSERKAPKSYGGRTLLTPTRCEKGAGIHGRQVGATPRVLVRNTTFQSREDPANEAGADEVLCVAHRALADVKADRDELLDEFVHCKSMLEISRGQVVASSQGLHTARNALFAHEILVEAQADRGALVHEMAHVIRPLML